MTMQLTPPFSETPPGVPGFPDLAEPRSLGAASTYDALADLFLGDVPAPAEREPRSMARATEKPAMNAAAPTRAAAGAPEIDLLIMGHLPVRTNPWASQYARARADAMGRPAALVRLIGGEVAVDLFGLAPEQRERQACSGLDRALRHVAEVCAGGCLILQADAVDEAGLASVPGAASVTLLCAASQTAEVAAYQSIKALAEAVPSSSFTRGGARLQMGIMGSDDERAQDIARRLSQTARMFLKREVTIVASIPRMGPTGAAAVYRGACTMDAAALVESIRRAIATVGVPGHPSAHADSARPVTAPIAHVAPTPATPRTSEPPSAPVPLRPSASPSTSLASRLSGMTPLAIRCPDDASVEFALDARGGVHLLRHGDDPEAVRSLTAAHAWASKNAQLLAMAIQGSCSGTPLTQHLFTATPRTVRPLLDSQVRVHLLAGVEMEGKTGWCCVELN